MFLHRSGQYSDYGHSLAIVNSVDFRSRIDLPARIRGMGTRIESQGALHAPYKLAVVPGG